MEQSTSYTAYEGHPSVATEADDMALLRRYVDLQSESAFSELVRRHMPWIHATCRKALRDAHRAEDAAQAVFIILARRAATITPQTRLSGWLFNTARFVVRDARKSETRYRRRESVARDLAADRLVLTPDRPALDADTQSALDDGLAHLTERDRLALIMHFYEGLSLDEMAPLLGIGKEGVKKRVSRALARLRARLGGKGKGTLTTLAVLALMLRARAAEAAPGGLGQAAVNAALVPGRASDLARAIAEQAMSTAAGASSRLLRAALVGQLATILVAVAVGTSPSSRPPAHRVATATPPRASALPASPKAQAFANPAPRPNRAPNPSGIAYATDPEPPYRSGADDPEVDPVEPRAQQVASSSSFGTETRAGAASSTVARASAANAGNSTYAGLPPVQRSAAAEPALPQNVDRAASLPRGGGSSAPSRAPRQPANPALATKDNDRGPRRQPADATGSPTAPAPGPGGNDSSHPDAPHDNVPPVVVADRGDHDNNHGGGGGRHPTRVVDSGEAPWHSGVRRHCDDFDLEDLDSLPESLRQRILAHRANGGGPGHHNLLGRAPTAQDIADLTAPAPAGLPQPAAHYFAADLTVAAPSDFTAAGAQAVPEPGAATIITISAAALLGRRRRRRIPNCPRARAACPSHG